MSLLPSLNKDIVGVAVIIIIIIALFFLTFTAIKPVSKRLPYQCLGPGQRVV